MDVAGQIMLKRILQRAGAEPHLNGLRHFAQPVTYLGVFVLVAIILITLYVINRERQDAYNAAVRDGGNIARLLEQHLARTIEVADQSLRLLQQSYLQDPQGFDMAAWIENPHVDKAITVQYAIVGAEGMMKATSAGPLPSPIYVGDRQEFRVHIDARSDALFIGPSIMLRNNGKWAFLMTRRLAAPDGSFMGVIGAAVDVQQIVNFYNSIDLGEHGAAIVVGFDGKVRIRRYSNGSVSDEAYGQASKDSQILTLSHQTSAGHYWGSGDKWDGIPRLVNFRVMEGLPLVIGVSFPNDAIYASVLRSSWVYFVIDVVIFVVVGITIWLGAVKERHQQMVEENQQRTEQAAIDRAEAVRARALAIAETETLRKHERALEAANRSKSLFLATMSHEIRTPMNAVLGIADILLETDLQEEQRKNVATIREAGGALLGIVNNILDFSQIEAGEVTLEAIAFSPDAVLDAVLGIMGPRAKTKGVAVRVVKDSMLPQALTGDAGRIRQVLLNLVSNAVKFTEAGEIVIDARCTARDERQAVIEWSVRDTGIGIAPDRIGALFKEFVQADSSINRRFGGSGLGLAICKRIVEQMGGEIRAMSTPGQGSRFSFTLPLPVAESAPMSAQHDAADVGAAFEQKIASLSRPLRILIADDHPTNRLVLSQMFRQFDCQLEMAVNGAEAVRLATQSPPDVILMDVRMPEMDGLQATRALRAQGGVFATLPIIAITANAFVEDAKACLESGMNDFTTKPVRKKVLIAAILGAMRKGEDKAIDQPAEDGATPCTSDQAVAEQTTSAPLVDRAAVDELVAEIGEEAAGEAFGLFVAETEGRLALFRQLTCTDDRSAIAHEAHALKGSAITFGLREVSQLAGMLEREATNIAAADYGAVIDRLDTLFAASRTQFPVPVPMAA